MIPLVFFLLSVASPATATPVTYSYTITGAVPDGAVSAQAIITLDPTTHTLEILLANLLANPTSDGQSISRLYIAGITGVPLLESSSADEGVPPGSTVTPRSGGTGWGFGAVPGGYALCIICPGSIHPPGKTAPPSLLIIGPPDAAGQYSNANASIYAHSPYLLQEAVFHLTGVTNLPPDGNTSPFSNVSLGFGTQPVELRPEIR